MEPGRPLREAFAELLNDESARSAYATDPDGFLGAYGHGDLPGSLVAEAIASFADSASPAVAEHLSPYVIAQSGITEPDGSEFADSGPGLDGLDLLASAPVGLELHDPAFDGPVLDAAPADAAGHPGAAAPAEDADDLDFGTGSDWWSDLPAHALDDVDPGGGLDAIEGQAGFAYPALEPEPTATGPLELVGTDEAPDADGDAEDDGADGI